SAMTPTGAPCAFAMATRQPNRYARQCWTMLCEMSATFSGDQHRPSPMYLTTLGSADSRLSRAVSESLHFGSSSRSVSNVSPTPPRLTPRGCSDADTVFLKTTPRAARLALGRAHDSLARIVRSAYSRV